jgi:hypothetical protein
MDGFALLVVARETAGEPDDEITRNSSAIDTKRNIAGRCTAHYGLHRPTDNSGDASRKAVPRRQDLIPGRLR